MKILQISNHYYPHVGVIGQVAKDISNTFSKDQVKVFCLNHKKENSVETVDGVEVIKAGTYARYVDQPYSFSYKKLLKRTFAEFKPDLVIFHCPNPFDARYVLKILKKYPECKLVLFWHLDNQKGKYFARQNNKLIKRAVKIIATSPNYIKGSKVLSKNADKCKLIPLCINNGRSSVDEYVLNRSKVIRESAEGKTICFACGKHVDYKGLEHLINASKLLSDDFTIFIAGNGPLTEDLKKQALGDNKIIFLGKISDEELKAYYTATDIFCFPSIDRGEAFGFALLEAMSFSKPTVTFNVPYSGINFVSVSGITGIEVPNGDHREFAKAIKKLGTDKELREKYGKAAKERINQNFTEEKFKQNIKELIDEIKG